MKELLISALKSSGELLLGYRNKPVISRQKESQSSIVTEADLASEENIINLISSAFPGHNIISEERGFMNHNSEFTWIIDPLDGTSNFAAGIPWFGILISLFKEDMPLLGGAYLPMENILYFAEAGKGAFRNGQLMPLLKETELKDSLIAFCVDYTTDIPFFNKGIGIYKNVVNRSRNIRSTNCLLDFLYVAEGRFGGVINLNTRVWDIAALGLIISETGGSMKYINGENIRYNLNEKIIAENFPVVAASGSLLVPLLEATR